MNEPNSPPHSTPLRGVLPPVVTPLRDRDALDEAGLERLIAHLVAGGVHGLFILGTTGEAPGLSRDLRHALVRRAGALAAGRAPLLVGITDTSFVESVALARTAAESGASGVVLAPPYYFPAGQEELLEYLQHLLPEIHLPLYLYNMPSHTKLVFQPNTVRRAADLGGVAGLKDSSGNLDYFYALQNRFLDRPDFALLMGSEVLLGETVLMGGHGGVCGGANLYPRLFVDTYEAARDGDLVRLRRLHQIIVRLQTTLYQVGRYGSSVLKGIKCALALRGLCDDFMTEPFHRFREPERRRVRECLAELDGLMAAEQGD